MYFQRYSRDLRYMTPKRATASEVVDPEPDP